MDASLQAELRIRRRLEDIFNKRRDEFGSKREYDDYLEMRETYSAPQGIAVLNLALGEDVVATEGKIAEYQRLNHANIARNRALKAGKSGDANTAATIAASTLQDPSKATETAAGGPTFQMDREAQLQTAQPMPASTDYTETADGTLKISNKDSKVSWRDVAAASGWNPTDALMNYFQQLSQHWL